MRKVSMSILILNTVKADAGDQGNYSNADDDRILMMINAEGISVHNSF